MKRINYIFICLVILVAVSCAKEEKDFFLASPAERINQALKDDFTALASAQNGWAMEYFATTESPGYMLLVKFEASGKATFAAKSELTKNKEYETDTCLFEMIADNGPVLTFNTYNKVLHRFSNPVDPDGFGLEGDYEFVIISTAPDKIVLKGKKRGSIVVLSKISNDVTWPQYIAGLDAMQLLLFSKDAPKLTLKTGQSIYSFSNGINHVFSIVKEGAGLNLPVDAPFIVTLSGIRFQSVQEIENVKFQTFELSEDKSSLICKEDPSIKLTGTEDLAIYFASNIKIWEFIPAELSPNIKSIYDQIVQSCVAKYNADEVKLAIRYYTTRKTFELTLTYMVGQIKNEGNLDLTLNTNGKNSLTLNQKGTGDNYGMNYSTDIEGYKEMSTIISTSFALSTNSMINPKKIKFVKNSEANTWFTVVPQ